MLGCRDRQHNELGEIGERGAVGPWGRGAVGRGAVGPWGRGAVGPWGRGVRADPSRGTPANGCDAREPAAPRPRPRPQPTNASAASAGQRALSPTRFDAPASVIRVSFVGPFIAAPKTPRCPAPYHHERPDAPAVAIRITVSGPFIPLSSILLVSIPTHARSATPTHQCVPVPAGRHGGGAGPRRARLSPHRSRMPCRTADAGWHPPSPQTAKQGGEGSPRSPAPPPLHPHPRPASPPRLRAHPAHPDR